MFLNKNNTIKWKRLALAAAVVAVLCLVGVLWLDKPLFEFMRNFDWSIWAVFDALFAAKVWLLGSLVAGMLIFVKNQIKTKYNKAKETNRSNVLVFVRNFILKTKTNYGFFVFCSILFGSLVGGVLKYVLGRARPLFFEALGQTGFYPFHSDWAFNSMPSGHTIASFAGVVMLGLLFPKWKWATWTFAIIVGVSRICYGAHWPSDVLLGAFIGMVSADMVKSLVSSGK